MNYSDLGYNQFLLRPLEASFVNESGIDSNTPYLLKGNQIASLNENLVLDLENDVFNVNEGNIKRIEIGRLQNGNIGLIVRDNKDNTLLNVTGEENIFQSSDGKTYFDLINNKMQISDDNGTVLIDGTGLVSTANFVFNSNFYSSTRTVNSDTMTDMANTTLTFTLSRQATMLFGFDAWFGSIAAVSIYAGLNIDGILYPNSTFGWGVIHQTATAESGRRSATYVKTLEQGAHTIKIQWRTDSGVGANDGYASDSNIYYLLLGK